MSFRHEYLIRLNHSLLRPLILYRDIIKSYNSIETSKIDERVYSMRRVGISYYETELNSRSDLLGGAGCNIKNADEASTRIMFTCNSSPDNSTACGGVINSITWRNMLTLASGYLPIIISIDKIPDLISANNRIFVNFSKA